MMHCHIHWPAGCHAHCMERSTPWRWCASLWPWVTQTLGMPLLAMYSAHCAALGKLLCSSLCFPFLQNGQSEGVKMGKVKACFHKQGTANQDGIARIIKLEGGESAQAISANNSCFFVDFFGGGASKTVEIGLGQRMIAHNTQLLAIIATNLGDFWNGLTDSWNTTLSIAVSHDNWNRTSKIRNYIPTFDYWMLLTMEMVLDSSWLMFCFTPRTRHNSFGARLIRRSQTVLSHKASWFTLGQSLSQPNLAYRVFMRREGTLYTNLSVLEEGWNKNMKIK